MIDILYESGERIFFNKEKNAYYAVKESYYLYTPGVILLATLLRVLQKITQPYFGSFVELVRLTIIVNVALIALVLIYDCIKIRSAKIVNISDLWIKNNMERIVDRYNQQRKALIVGIAFFGIGMTGLFISANYIFLMMEASGLAFVVGTEHYTRLGQKKGLLDAMKIRMGI